METRFIHYLFTFFIYLFIKLHNESYTNKVINFQIHTLLHGIRHSFFHYYTLFRLQYIADLPTSRRGRLRSSTSSVLNVRPSRRVTVGDRSFAPCLHSETVYLPTSSLPHHSQHFVRNRKHIYYGNHSQTLFSSCVAIVVLKVSFT